MKILFNYKINIKIISCTEGDIKGLFFIILLIIRKLTMVKQLNISLLMGVIGLFYIVLVTLLREDSVLFLKFNILVPMIIITFSLSFVTYNISKTFIALKDAFNTFFVPSKNNSEFSYLVLEGLYRNAYISCILWILYGGVTVFSTLNYSIDSYISSSFVAISYAFIFSEVFIKTTLLKISNNKK